MIDTNITPDASGAAVALAKLWREASLGSTPPARFELLGDRPLLPSSFHVGVAAQSTIAAAALAAAELGSIRGDAPRSVSVDMHAAEYECTGYFAVNGASPPVWAPLSGLYKTADGFVRIHANFDHHRDGALHLLGLDSTATREDVETQLRGWRAAEFEDRAATAGLVVSAARDFHDWDRHPQSAAVASLPLFEIDRIGDAPVRQLPRLDAGSGPLAGIRVLDLTRILAGPVCGRTLAAYGADVMLVNAPYLPNIENIADTSRGKLSVHIDLKSAEGVATLGQLASGAQVFVEGYRPGGLAGLGFGPAALAGLAPGIVYVSLSAYSHEGPWCDRRGFDSLVQTASGFNFAEAEAAGSAVPRPLPVQILDYASGFLMAFAAQAALIRQQQEGGSWHVRVSLAQTAHWLRRLGRVTDNFKSAALDFASHAETGPSGFGELTAMPHAARFNNSPISWARRSNPPGSHLPVWP